MKIDRFHTFATFSRNFNSGFPFYLYDTSVTDVTVINRVIDTSINVELRIIRCLSDLYILSIISIFNRKYGNNLVNIFLNFISRH